MGTYRRLREPIGKRGTSPIGLHKDHESCYSTINKRQMLLSSSSSGGEEVFHLVAKLKYDAMRIEIFSIDICLEFLYNDRQR